MKWTLLTGSWGDVFAGYGNLCNLYADHDEKINVVYFGLDPDICTFLKAQPNIGEVKHLLISEPAAFFKYNRLAATNFVEFMEVTGLKESVPDMSPGHVSSYYLEEHPDQCNRFHDCQLPTCPADWWMFLSRKRPFVLFQPYSIRSVSFDQHWPHWMDALNWVLEHTEINVVLAGELRSPFDTNFVFPWVEHERLINIVGQTKSMLDLLHIATWADKIITTSNALSMWSIINRIPALVVCHQLIRDRAPYYYNWIHDLHNTVVDFETDLQGFKTACIEWSNPTG